jgi:mannosyltransferase
VTVSGDMRERTGAVRLGSSGDSTRASRAFEDLVDRAARVPWCWSALLTLALGLYQVSRPELWRDELASWIFATRSVSGLIATAHKSNAAQLPYYLLLHFWIAAFGDSADAMRLLSVLAMAGAAACVSLVGRRLAGARAGLLAGLVFALVPSVSRFAQEIRFYSLEVLVATLATLLLLRALDRPSLPRWVLYALCLAVLGCIDLVALSVVAGHAVAAAMRWWHDREKGQFGFVPAAAAGLAACLPLVVAGVTQAHAQVKWIVRPGLDLGAFSSFGRNLFYSTSVAAALIVLAVLAWAVARREAAFATTIAIAPVAAVWLVSQGPLSYFFPRYLLLTVGAWAILAGIGLCQLDVRVAAAAVVIIAILGAGDQQVIREPGAHSWSTYPVGTGVSYLDYAGAASAVAEHAKPGDSIFYQAREGGIQWLMIGYGVQYYLQRDMPHGVPVPRQVFIAETSAQADSLYAIACAQPAACLGHEPRIWIVGGGHVKSPYKAVTPAEAALLRQSYRVSYVKHVWSLTVFLLTRTPAPGGANLPGAVTTAGSAQWLPLSRPVYRSADPGGLFRGLFGLRWCHPPRKIRGSRTAERKRCPWGQLRSSGGRHDSQPGPGAGRWWYLWLPKTPVSRVCSLMSIACS